MRASVKYMVLFRHKDKYPISKMCRVFSVSRSGYYAYASRMELPAKDFPLAEKIRECQDKCDKTYGYRNIINFLLKIINKYHINSPSAFKFESLCKKADKRLVYQLF